MKYLRAWLRRFAGLFGNKQGRDADLVAELESHLQLHIDENLRKGMTEEEARRDALIKLGGVEQTKENYRDQRGIPLLETGWADVRFAFRMLGKSPGFTAAATLTLALGIGATTAIFSALNPVLFEPLPYPHASQMIMIWPVSLADGSRNSAAFHTFRELAQRSRALDAIAVMKAWQPTLVSAAEPERFDGQFVSAGYFRVLGVPPAIGRDFESSDDLRNGPKVVILSDWLWRRRFAGDRSIIGRQILLDDSSYSVIGIMPASFENVLAPSAELWTTLQYDAGNMADQNTREWGHHLQMAGRIRAGLGTEQARRDLEAIARTPVPEFPRPRFASLSRGFLVDSLQDDVTRGVRPALLAVLGAVILVLLIACVNVTNLLLARGAQRRGEFALRATLGAGPTRMIRQLLTESLLLAIVGGILGITVAQFGVRTLVALSPPGLPRVGAIRLDGAVLAFAIGVTTLVGLAVGLIPAWHASRSDLQAGLQQSSRRATGVHHLTRRALVISQVALALMLLVTAGLLLRSLHLLFSVAPGFNSSRLITMQVQTYGKRYDGDNVCIRFFAQALEAVRNVPGVSAAAFTSQLPLSGDSDVYGAHLENDNDPNDSHDVFRYGVTPGYFETMGIPLRSGRLFDTRDLTRTEVRPVLINESFAKRKFPGQDPIGQRIRVGGLPGRPWDVIVGVVGDVKQTSLAASQSDAVYVLSAQWLWADGTMSLAVRARGNPAALVPAIKKAIWSVDKDQPVVRVASMDDLIAATASERRFALVLFETFGVLALMLAATGIYGVLSSSVTERTHEIGVRAALGAVPVHILALILHQGILLTGVGVAIGLIGAVIASQAVTTLLYGISRLDPITYLGVIALLLGVSVAACGVPAWRAARVDPMTALRYE
ncbi:MAG TPA: ABC transporter permease [Candidatus Angelobacter sp.]|nr:ABC transporter permease [Candidatus Angelobacter sp.]